MTQKIDTTTRKLRAGVAISERKAELHWQSTGHLSFRLLDASGSVPLAARKVVVDVPDEGTVTLTTDDDGCAQHLDVPFQDYELDLDGVKVMVPAVGEPSEVHQRHVVGVTIGFIHAVVFDGGGFPLAGETLAVTFPSGAEVDAQTDDDGVLLCQHEDPGTGDADVVHDCGRAKIAVAASPQKIVPLELEPAS